MELCITKEYERNAPLLSITAYSSFMLYNKFCNQFFYLLDIYTCVLSLDNARRRHEHPGDAEIQTHLERLRSEDSNFLTTLFLRERKFPDRGEEELYRVDII